MLHVKEARYLQDFKIWISFDDGSSGEVDFSGILSGEVFEPLKDENFFKLFYFDEELKTIVWPNGVDLAPEFLKKQIEN